VARLERKDTVLRVGVTGAPAGSALKAHGGRITLRLPAHARPVTFKVFVTRDATAEALRGLMRRAPAGDDLPALCRGGKPRWPRTITLSGKRGPDTGAYTVDRVPLPEDNPWGSWLRPSGLDFLSDGRLALCTWNGDVWVASGLDAGLAKVTWRRFATGLFEPLGLKVVNDKVYVVDRAGITRLHDLDGDGEADFYENFNNDAPTTPTFHGFAMELHTDRAGNFYYARGAHRTRPGTPFHGGVIKVSRDGSKAELLCTGLREPNGLGVGPDDLLTAADNQGNWVPSSKIDVVRPGRFYGYVWGDHKGEPEKPLCWLPMSEDNSSGGQVWVTSKRWGPLEGHLLHTSYGTGKLFSVFVQRDGKRFQGGAIAFPLAFDTGIIRGRFAPHDGQLYLCGLKGWGTSAKSDGGLYRVRHTGRPLLLPTGLRVRRGQVELTFAVPLDRASVRPEHFALERWNYRWTKDYGSKDYSVRDPKRVGRDHVEVRGARLSADGRTVTLDVPELAPVMQMATGYRLRARGGEAVEGTVYHTINHLPER
jgi:hypothetical protein